MIFDSHTHIDSDDFDADRDEVIQRARQAGVKLMVDPGCDVASSERAVSLSGSVSEVYAAVGIHPHSAKAADDAAFDHLRTLYSAPKVVAVGETGLDYHYDFSPREQQRASLERHIELSHETRLPLILHCRNAEDDLIAMLRRLDGARHGGVVHCFTGPWEHARTLLDMGFYIGITGIVTFKKATEVHETAVNVPLDRLLVETDAPYLAPLPHRGKRNEPAYVLHTVQQIASLRGASGEVISQAVTQNARRLFNI
ncbi:MAG TPA: TatD family hydrolase [Candidatus Xenobia bacterium]|jgi:TatD DNase family protein